MWRKDVDPATGDEVVSRVGWWGNDYDLLSNNCCFLTDHLLKILVGKPLPVRAEPPSLLNLSLWKENTERRSFAKTGSGQVEKDDVSVSVSAGMDLLPREDRRWLGAWCALFA